MTSDHFRRVPTAGPLRAVLIGAGGMGQAWLTAVEASRELELVGVVDLDLGRAQRMARGAGRENVHAASTLSALTDHAEADVVINVTTPDAHAPVTLEALGTGRPVLCEKPLAARMPEALLMAAMAYVTGELLMVSQSYRYDRDLIALRRAVADLRGAGLVTCQFFKAPSFGGFRDQMEHPLLVEMAIHHFDLVRYLLGSEPVSVYCEEFDPPWSWYEGAAAATTIFEMSDGSRFVHTGCWCSPGRETTWHGEWRLSGPTGSLTWDGTGLRPRYESSDGSVIDLQPGSLRAEGISGALDEFAMSLRTGQRPTTDVFDNVLSLAMVHAAIESQRLAARVSVDAVLDSAHTEAIEVAPDPARRVLESWRSVRSGLAASG